MNWTLEFKDLLAVQPENTGGKGANLARLTSGGFNVPHGFVVIAAAYREWVGTAEWWRRAVPDLRQQDPTALALAATKLREQLRLLPPAGRGHLSSA